MTRNSWHGARKGKLRFTNLLALYDEITGLVDEGRAVGAVYLDFSKTVDPVCHNIITNKLMKYGLQEQRVRWTKNHLN